MRARSALIVMTIAFGVGGPARGLAEPFGPSETFRRDATIALSEAIRDRGRETVAPREADIGKEGRITGWPPALRFGVIVMLGVVDPAMLSAWAGACWIRSRRRKAVALLAAGLASAVLGQMLLIEAITRGAWT